MARKKVKLQYIENDTARKVTYKKRVKGLLKKTEELSILCGVDACTIVYSAYDQAPRVWPWNEAEVRRILMEYQQKPNIDQSQRILTHEGFLEQSKSKSGQKLQRLQRRNRELEMENVMGNIISGRPVLQVPYSDVDDLKWVIEDKLRTFQHWIRVVEGHHANANANANAPPLPLTNEMIGGSQNTLFQTHVGPSNPFYYQQ